MCYMRNSTCCVAVACTTGRLRIIKNHVELRPILLGLIYIKGAYLY